jgi:hypothetical protein
LCDSQKGECRPPECEPGTFRCEGAELKTCNDARTNWLTVQNCETADLCNQVSGICNPVGCTTPGKFRCSDEGVIERCADDRSGWTGVDTCLSAGHCDAVKGECSAVPCESGARQCNESTLQVCKDGKWGTADTCQTDELCQLTLTENARTCEQPICDAGSARCVDEQPQICNAGRTGYRDNGAPCETVELCNRTNGTCATPACDPNDTRCTGAQPEICNAGRTGYVANGAACASAALCNPSTGTCGEKKCREGQLQCDPANPTRLQRCKADLTGYEPTPCDVCETAELCTASLSATTCDQTSCKEPVCNIGEHRCGGSGADLGKVLEMCNAGRTGYSACDTCVTKELCDASVSTTSCTATSCTEPSCGASERWCGGTGTLGLYQCPASRIKAQAVTPLQSCVTKELCELTIQNGKATCEAPSCALTDKWCGGTGNLGFYQCPASRINFRATLLDTCATNGLCELSKSNNKTTCEAPTCAITDKWCAGTGNLGLYQCPASRISSEATLLDTCVTNGLCELSKRNNKTTCEAPKCNLGATQCAGTGNKTLQMCASDRTGFTDCDVCATAQLCTDSRGATSCNANACLACAAGEAHCNASGNYETCRADRTGFTVTDCEDSGCDETLGGCLTTGQGGGGG